MLSQNAKHDLPCFGGIARPMHMTALRRHRTFELFEQFIEPRERVIANCAPLFPQGFLVAITLDSPGARQREMCF